jgi:hypothetical protein
VGRSSWMLSCALPYSMQLHARYRLTKGSGIFTHWTAAYCWLTLLGMSPDWLVPDRGPWPKVAQRIMLPVEHNCTCMMALGPHLVRSWSAPKCVAASFGRDAAVCRV